jgi:hypothetical protein
MTGLTLPTTRPASGLTPPRRPAGLAATAPAVLTATEAARIADAFPARPAVAQKLYGPGRQVQQAPQIGTRLDLSA